MPSRLVKGFFSWNQQLCRKAERLFTPEPSAFLDGYTRFCADYINANPDLTVLDIGTGRRLQYQSLLTGSPCHIIGCDVDAEEIKHNQGIHTPLVCDASTRIDLPDQSVDFITSYYCVEHLPDVERFIQECGRVLKPDGAICLIFAGGYSLHAILNKLLPHSIASALLHFLIPNSRNSAGFKAFYDKGTHSDFSRLLTEAGFSVTEYRERFGSRGYFSFLLPLYMACFLLDLAWQATRNHDLASDYIYLARKQAPAQEIVLPLSKEMENQAV